jgi:hypothetical protein
VVSPPPAPTPPVQSLAVAPKPKRHPRHPKAHVRAAPAAPVPVSRGEGGPARSGVVDPLAPVAFQASQPGPIAPSGTRSSDAAILLLFVIAFGLALLLASVLPGPVLRPALVYELVAVHRIDFALVGGSIVIVVGALYLITG